MSLNKQLTTSKVSTIRNPLALIGIFASLAEISGTIVLKDLDCDLQKIFIWFVMLFPFTLIIAFFCVLWFRPAAFYSPEEMGQENFVQTHGVKTKRKRVMIPKGKKMTIRDINPE